MQNPRKGVSARTPADAVTSHVYCAILSVDVRVNEPFNRENRE